MKAMKVWAIILTCVFFASLTGFIITAAMTRDEIVRGFRNGVYFTIGDYRESAHDVSETFSDNFSHIEIAVVSARTTISISRDDKARVEYKGSNPAIEFTADIRNNTLVIHEKSRPMLFNWGWNSWGSGDLVVEIPAKEYGELKLSVTSGTTNAELHAANFTLDTLILKATSGNITLDLPGYANLQSFEIGATSGRLNVNGLSGRGRVKVTSGNVNLTYADWNDALDVEVTSGNVEIKTPQNSGADLDFSRSSGSLKYDLNGDNGKLTGSATLTVGGHNVRRVWVRVTSGSVSIIDN
ncbi:MAG: DUF4097 domain-containing protein [Oscillospiraceae bacterium]|nr:DUF4097 domain-containing protein [Oscillospiraceae bacterium]